MLQSRIVMLILIQMRRRPMCTVFIVNTVGIVLQPLVASAVWQTLTINNGQSSFQFNIYTFYDMAR